MHVQMHERSQAERHYFTITHFSSKFYRNLTDLYDLELTIVDGLACIHIATNQTVPIINCCDFHFFFPLDITSLNSSAGRMVEYIAKRRRREFDSP